MTLAAKLTDKQKWQRLLSSLRYSLYVIFHPFDGFWDLSREKRGSLGAANIIVFLVLLVRLLSMQFTPFLFMNVYWPSVNIIQQCLAVLLPLLFFVAGNWGLTTLFEGKGTFKDVYIATCYALTPYVILQAAMILLANIITAKEGAFYYVLEGLSLGWSGVLIICGMMQTHDYSLGKTLLFTIMTLLAMVVIIFLLLLFFSLVGDGIGYFVSLYNIMVIPACYDADRAWKIAFAYNLFTNPTPGYTDSDDWKNGYYQKYRDERAVDETITMMREPEHQFVWYSDMVTGYDLGSQYIWDVYAQATTPAEKAESMRGTWQAYIDEANAN